MVVLIVRIINKFKKIALQATSIKDIKMITFFHNMMQVKYKITIVFKQTAKTHQLINFNKIMILQTRKLKRFNFNKIKIIKKTL